jgi:hypothetical protein
LLCGSDAKRAVGRAKEVGEFRNRSPSVLSFSTPDAQSDHRQPLLAADPAEPVRPRIVVSDATPEALGGLLAAHEKGLLFFRDELAGWFSSFGRYSGSGADRAFWVEGYGGRAFTIDRVKHPLPVIIPRLSLGVLGGVQPDRLWGCP